MCLALCAGAALPGSSLFAAPAPEKLGITSTAAAAPDLQPGAVAEPRYVASTLRDGIGRIWAPVYLNGKGPFRLVLDTGASSSAITVRVADELGLPLAGARTMLLQGVTGSIIVPIVTVDSFLVGDMQAHDKLLPIVPDALGGADGVLGKEGLQDKRVSIDFRHGTISITHSEDARAGPGYVTLPVERTGDGLLMATAYIGSIRIKAIIDTGAQVTVANSALEAVLRSQHAHWALRPASITGATDDVQEGQDMRIPPIRLGPIQIQAPFLTFGNLHIFDRWNMTQEPAMLIGLDMLGLLDDLVIDYRRQELQLLTRHNN